MYGYCSRGTQSETTRIAEKLYIVYIYTSLRMSFIFSNEMKVPARKLSLDFFNKFPYFEVLHQDYSY